MFCAALPSPPPPPGGEGAELCLMRRYLTSTLGAGLGGQWGQEGPRSEVPACELAVSLHDTVSGSCSLSRVRLITYGH